MVYTPPTAVSPEDPFDSDRWNNQVKGNFEHIIGLVQGYSEASGTSDVIAIGIMTPGQEDTVTGLTVNTNNISSESSGVYTLNSGLDGFYKGYLKVSAWFGSDTTTGNLNVYLRHNSTLVGTSFGAGNTGSNGWTELRMETSDAFYAVGGDTYDLIFRNDTGLNVGASTPYIVVTSFAVRQVVLG